MALRAALAAWVLALGCAWARAQPQPPQAPPTLDQLAQLVRQQPSDARSVIPRFGALTMALRLRGIPPAPGEMLRLKRVRRMLGEGRLTPAAQAFDRLVIDLAGGPEGGSSQGPGWSQAEAQAPRAPAAAAPDGSVLGETPKLLSNPAPSAPLASAPAAVTPLAPVAASPASAPAAPSGPPWPLFVAGLGLLGGAAWLFRRISGSRTERAPTPLPGKLRDKYEVGQPIARGGMGEVFEGKDLSLGRRVAIKRMLPDIGLDAELRQQFLKEARTVAKLSHPYIVQIHECVEDGGDLYLVFEYVDGEPLARRLSREARLPLKECQRVFGYVCKAVDHAHKNHVLHRDLKPANIMLDKDGIARVMDFGIALESTRTLTSTGTAPLAVAGTLRYMPPEQHFGRSVRASDVYAMGVCLYEMATGHPPFTASTVEELLEQKRARRFPPASTLVPGLGKDFDMMVSAALAPDPGSRVSSALEFLEALEGLTA